MIAMRYPNNESLTVFIIMMAFRSLSYVPIPCASGHATDASHFGKLKLFNGRAMIIENKMVENQIV